MWRWSDEQHTYAMFDGGDYAISCGVSLEPLASWLSEGNQPEPYIPAEQETA